MQALIKSLTRRTLCHPKLGRLIGWLCGNRISAYGAIFDTSHPRFGDKWKAQLFFGYYERCEVGMVEKYLRSDLDVIELGSSLGVVSAVIAKKLAPARKLISVEANPRLIEIVSSNLTLNGRANAAVIHSAIDYSGRANVSLEVDKGQLGARVAPEGLKDGGLPVSSLQLRALLATYKIGDYALVCDIEGSELGILQADGGALSGCQQLIIELHRVENPETGETVTIDQMCDRIQALGLKIKDCRERTFFFTRTPQ